MGREMSSEPGGNPPAAIFLSYSRDDATAAARLAEGLRAAGVEVWFDQNELCGGDAWDRAIRRQIRDCALFVPLISAGTQARTEGYFRLEWHLAEQRSLLIAKGRPFIVPVCVDATPERVALVPEAFLAVQWTRLPGGDPTAALVGRLRGLLGLTQVAPAAPASGTRATSAAEAGLRIPDYELLRKIGSGSYGDVWLARGVTGIYRAIKIVWRDRFADAEPFEREFRGLTEFAAISLGESIQLALLHVGHNEAAGFFYYVMELADDAQRGREIDPKSYAPLTLTELRAQRGRVPAEECVKFGVELARVLASLHRRGLLHRDIKPSNVILVGGVPKLADIGLVAPASEARTFIGTEGFVPPEGPGSPAADVYALGKVLYELSTGLDRQEFPQLPADMKRLPDRRGLLELNEIILRACDPRRERRYRDGAALLEDLLALQAGGSLRRRRVGRKLALVAAASAAVVTLGAFGWRSLRPPVAESVSNQRPEAAAAPKSVPPPIPEDEKSLVVLPLENLSTDPENAFFTDGMHAEIVASLSRLADLKVVSRATAQTFKGTPMPLPEIGAQLGVANVLSGSVRRDGRSVRVQLELRRAKDEALLWQNTFNRELQPGFALQDEIVADVARILQARSITGWYSGARFMTKDPEAYVLFLQAREIPYVQGTSRAALAEQIRLAEAALQRDPEFMSAASLLASAYVYYWSTETDAVKRIEIAAQAKRWAEKASQLVPGGAGDGALAVYYGMIERDSARALPFALNEVRALPNDPNGHNRLASNLNSHGRTQDALAAFDRAVALDPLNVRVLHNRVGVFARLRRVPEFETAAARSLEFGGRNVDRALMADFRFRLTGKLPESLENLAGFLPGRPMMLWYGRRFEELLAAAERAVENLQENPPHGRLYFLLWRLRALRWLGRDAEVGAAARDMLAHAESVSTAEPDERAINERIRMWGLVGADRADEALAIGRRRVEAAAAPARTAERWDCQHELAQLCAWLGRTRDCVELLEALVRVPSVVPVPYLRLAPDWDNVREDAAFKTLLADPKNSGPL